MRLLNAGLLEQLLNNSSGLRAVGDPLLSCLGIDLDISGIRVGVVVAELLDRSAAPGSGSLCYDDPVHRNLLLTDPLQSDFNCHDFTFLLEVNFLY